MEPASTAGPVALVGSGEFTPAMAAVDRLLLRGRPPRAVFLPTAAGQEGAERIGYWVRLGRTHYEDLGVEPVPLLVLDRASADDPELAAEVEGAGLVYLSGGDPAYLAATLAGTRVGDAILA
ncbi:MAG: Type 1 glutamine amidotransferase-like domain-containing protein, partial [Acidimicrobiia bacterium]